MSNMKDGTYNGWTNYATWRVNLEIFDGLDPEDMGWTGLEAYDLAPILCEYAADIIESTAPEGLARDYAMAFVDSVNYREIAEFLLEVYTDETA